MMLLGVSRAPLALPETKGTSLEQIEPHGPAAHQQDQRDRDPQTAMKLARRIHTVGLLY